MIERHPAFQSQAKRSLGREDFTVGWVNDLVDRFSVTLSPADIVASVVDAVARLVGKSPMVQADEAVLAGGGAHNAFLVDKLTDVLPVSNVLLSDTLGVPIEARESAGFAVLGALCEDRVPICLPQITGSTCPGVSGHWILPGATM